MPLFETCEDLEDIVDLHLLYNVLEGICKCTMTHT